MDFMGELRLKIVAGLVLVPIGLLAIIFGGGGTVTSDSLPFIGAALVASGVAGLISDYREIKKRKLCRLRACSRPATHSLLHNYGSTVLCDSHTATALIEDRSARVIDLKTRLRVRADDEGALRRILDRDRDMLGRRRGPGSYDA